MLGDKVTSSAAILSRDGVHRDLEEPKGPGNGLRHGLPGRAGEPGRGERSIMIRMDYTHEPIASICLDGRECLMIPSESAAARGLGRAVPG